MPPYDAGWGGPRGRGFGGGQGGPMPGGRGYGGDFRPVRGPGGGGIDRVRYDAGFDRGGSAHEVGGDWEDTPVHGPARYGLGPYHDRLRKRTRPDDELRSEVEEALFYDTWVDAEAIEVQVRDGIVTLRSELPDYGEVRYATDDAWDVDGVRGVRSELTVRSAQRDNQKRYGLDRTPPGDVATGRGGDERGQGG